VIETRPAPNVILIIANIEPTAAPTNTIFCGIDCRVHEGLHAQVEKRIRFRTVDDVELVLQPRLGMRHREVEPLHPRGKLRRGQVSGGVWPCLRVTTGI